MTDTSGFSVGDVVRKTTTSYDKAQADSASNAEVVGIIGEILSSTEMVIYTGGYISGYSSLSVGDVYYLSELTAGAITINEPADPGEISKPCLIAISSSEGMVITAMRGEVIPA